MDESWPDLPFDAWRETRATLQLWTQIVGKIRLALTPWLNHSWHVPLYVNVRGLTTSPIAYGSRAFEIQFDFIAHRLDIQVSDGSARQIALKPQSVAQFHQQLVTSLSDLGIRVSISEQPCEIADAIAFTSDQTHCAYQAIYAQRFWQILLRTDQVFKTFRTGFIGKCSPVHFFWGSFDLAVTRFSGRMAPPFTGKTPGVSLKVMREAYSHEVSSAGFWPGGGGVEHAAFYSYAYPVPLEFARAPLRPPQAFFSATLGEFLLPYDAVRTASNPQAALLDFLQSTYEAAAIGAQWDRAALECQPGMPGVPRFTAGPTG